MIEGKRILVIAPVLDEAEKIPHVIKRMPSEVDEVLVVDDGSTDGSPRICRDLGATVIELGITMGVGAAIRAGYQFGLSSGYEVIVVIAGNNKDSPEEIPQLVRPIIENQADFVQGSRWLKDVSDFGDMPLYRRVATRIHPALFNVFSPVHMTDTTNGFRAVTSAVLTDRRLRLDQSWLDEYELEVYLLFKAAALGYRVVEVPVTKRYPPKSVGYTKMKPVVGWWSILRPLVLLGTGIKK